MRSFRTVISCDYPIYSEEVGTDGKHIITTERKYFPIDYLEDRKVTASSNVASHPLMSGDTISDHMYRNPTTISIGGVFSLSGRNYKNKSYDFIGEKGDRLTNIQKVFEFIKNNAILCDIVTLEIDVDRADPDDDSKNEYSSSNTRFITRHNMALTNISWTEKVNSMGFNLDFKEVITINDEDMIQEADLDLPNIYQPRVASLGTVLNDLNILPKTIIEILNQNGYIDKKWAEAVWDEVGQGIQDGGRLLLRGSVAALIGVIVLKVAIAALIKFGIISATGAVVGAVVPVGTIIVAAAAALFAIGVGIKKLIERDKNKDKKKKMFKMVNNAIDTDYERMVNLIDEIGIAMNKQNNNLIIYDFQFAEGDDDTKVNNQYLVTLGNELYYLNVVSKNVEPYFDVQILSSKANGGEEISPKQVKNSFPVVTNIQDCKDSRCWFTNTTGEYKAFLMNPSLSSEINKTPEEIESTKPHWKYYTIWVCKGSMEDQLKVVNDTIVEQVEKRGYGS